MGDTSIEWCDKTWNPVRGCSRVSTGCEHCYAETTAARFIDEGQPYEGLATRVHRIRSDARGHQRGVTEGRWTGVVRMVPEHLADPLRWKKPARIFVNSMSDLFHEKLTNEQIAAVFGVMAAAPRHTFQVLTKRAKRMRDWFRWLEKEADAQGDEWAGRECGVSVHDARDACRMEILDEAALGAMAGHFNACHLGLTTAKMPWPLPNVWLGVSVENQAAADERIPLLLETPAALRFLSCEPLLGPLRMTLHGAHIEGWDEDWHYNTLRGVEWGGSRGPEEGDVDGTSPRLDWVIAGCESGPGARPAEVDWYRQLRDQCAAAGVPFFLKQAVEVAPDWPPEARLRGLVSIGVGATLKARGVISLPYLDGVQHAAFPERT